MPRVIKYSTSSDEEVVVKKIPIKSSAKKKSSIKKREETSSSEPVKVTIKKVKKKETSGPKPVKTSAKKISKEKTKVAREESPNPVKIRTKKSSTKKEESSSPVLVKPKTNTKKPTIKIIKKEETSSPEPAKQKTKSSNKKSAKREETSSPEPAKQKSKSSIKKSSKKEEIKSEKKGIKAKIPHSSKKEKEIDYINIKGGRLLSFPVKEEKGFLEIMKDYIFSIDLATVRSFFKTLKGEVDLYPTLKGNLRDTGLVVMKKYEDFMDAPTDPIISNISLGFLEDFMPKFKMLLLNLTRIGGPVLVSSFLDATGFTETKFLRLLKIGKDPKEQIKIIAKMFIQVSNPLCWVFIITNIVRAGYDIYKYFDDGGVIGKLGLIKDSEGIEKKLRIWTEKVIRTTISSMLDDLTSVIEDQGTRDNSNKILKLLLLGTGKSKMVKVKQEKVESKSYLEPILVKIRMITKPINKQVGNVVGELTAQSLDYLINRKYDFEVKTLFSKESLLLLNKENGYEVEDEESVQWALQEIGGLSSILISNLLASFATSFEGVNFKPEELLTKEVDTSYISSGIKKVFDIFKR